MDQQPGFILGGVSRDLGTNASAGAGRYFVIEADEYDRMFLGLSPKVILLTNVEYDHPDCFPTVVEYRSAFAEFVKKLQPGGLLVTNADQEGAASMISEMNPGSTAVTYGFAASAVVRAQELHVNNVGGISFSVFTGSSQEPRACVNLQVPGEHNVRNALGVLAVHHALGNKLIPAAAALSSFTGTGRRFEIIAEIAGVTIIDDYAHHPSKIRATLAAARTRYPGRRLIAVWQPHTYSRTQALEDDFVASFADADQVIVTDIYASREKEQPYSVDHLVQKINYVPTLYINSLQGVTEYLAQNLQPEDVLLVLSAGDADRVCREVTIKLKERK